jgi:hypothetical protein
MMINSVPFLLENFATVPEKISRKPVRFIN